MNSQTIECRVGGVKNYDEINGRFAGSFLFVHLSIMVERVEWRIAV